MFPNSFKRVALVVGVSPVLLAGLVEWSPARAQVLRAAPVGGLQPTPVANPGLVLARPYTASDLGPISPDAPNAGCTNDLTFYGTRDN